MPPVGFPNTKIFILYCAARASALRHQLTPSRPDCHEKKGNEKSQGKKEKKKELRKLYIR
jgi:hypothetical protein